MKKDLENKSRLIRREILQMVARVRSSHIGGSFSVADILTALYFKILKINPKHPENSKRDLLVFSKGHCAAALYAVLAERGFFPKSVLEDYFTNGKLLTGHPTKGCLPGVETSTGSLGHGLPMGAGMAFAAKYDKSPSRVFVIMSDGECDEGSVWEAALVASHNRLDNLVAIIDYNKLQAFGRISDVLSLEPLKKKWESFGWAVKEIDGHNFDEILSAFEVLPFEKGKPSVVIAHTIKGKGVSYMENKLEWHYKNPQGEEVNIALRELS